MKLRLPRWFVGLVALEALIILAVGLFFYFHQEKKMYEHAGRDLSSAAKLKAHEISLWRENRVKDLQVITESPFFCAAAVQLIRNPQAGVAKQMKNRFESYKRLRSYTDLLLTDDEGQVRFSLGEKVEFSRAEENAARLAIAQKKPLLIETVKEKDQVAFTVFSPLNGAGVLAVRMDPKEVLQPRLQVWPGISESGQYILVSRKDEKISILNQPREIPPQELLRAALTSQKSWVSARGKNGRKLLVAYAQVPATDWFVMALVDERELLYEWHLEERLIAIVFIFFLLASVALTAFFWQRNEKHHYRRHYEDLSARFEAEERNRVTLRSIGEGVLVTDKEGKIVLMNEMAQKITEWPEEEVLGKPVAEVFHIINEISGEPVENPVARVFKEGTVVGLANHTVLITRTGKTIPIADSGAPVRNAEGEIIGAVLVFRDQTEERNLQRALHESELWFRTTFYSIGDGVITTDTQGKLKQMNPVAEKLTGWREEEAKKREITEVFNIVNEFSRLPVENPVHRVLKEGLVVGLANHTLLVSRDGNEYPIADAGSPIKDEEGNILGTVLIFRDQTEERQAQDRLKRSEALLRLIFHTSPDATSLNRMEDGVFVDINENFTSWTGYKREEVIGKTALDLNLWADPEVYRNFARLILKEGYCDNFESVFRLKDGSTTYGILSARVISIEGVPHVISVTRNIADLKRLAEEKRSLEERLHRVEKMEALGLLAGGVAHDLNNILGILVGYSELLLLKLKDNESLKDHVQNILKAGERAAAIVQDLLTMARRGLVVEEVVNLNEIIREQLHTPELERILKTNLHVKLVTELDPELLNLTGSPVHLAKSLTNLLVNAVEAMPRGGTITLKTANCYLDHPVHGYDSIERGEYVLLSVSDTGEGISSEDLPHIFEPFYTKKVMGRSGSGLGLSVVWGTVKDHHGYIDVQSAPGRGTTFYLYFPATRKAISKRDENCEVGDTSYLGNKELILVVDDVKEQRELAKTMLEKLNYRVITLSSGEEAVEYLKEHDVDLILLDMIMDPGIDGYETYRRIRLLGKKPKAIIVSGYAETERVSMARKLGVGRFVKKPYILKRLGEAIRSELNKS
ncbi:MAG TPA: PAS domain S-box protein [Syntrophales bacterium]|nr:PAS domain S-box protein [Syntrophales bacterium]HOL59582.1 PAS domain S-box protein [Syntrophales bacterium]HPO35672.1 PAS domain S-box protein [Syntrophales bacterium]